MNTKVASLLLLLTWQAAARRAAAGQAATGREPPVAQPQHMQYERAMQLEAGSGQACALLDAQIFPHAAPSLKDLRIFPAQVAPGSPVREVPYAITLSETMSEETERARVLNLGSLGEGAGAKIVFDLEMPDRPYTEVTLDLAGQDFLATAAVAGMESLGGKQTALGVFTLFDLSSQKLSHDTTLPLQESTFRYLHVVLSVSAAPGGSSHEAGRFGPAMVQGAEVPPSRQAQTVYTTVATISSPTTGALASPRKTRFDVTLPLRVPVERVSFDLPASFSGNFSRDIRINASPAPGPAGKAAATPAASPPVETFSGTISRVHATQAGRRIDEQQLSIPATLGSNLQSPANVIIEVENGDDQPLPIARVRLEMRQRKLCFDVANDMSSGRVGGAGRAAGPDASGGLMLYYGDPTLLAPVYDYGRLFVPAAKPLAVTLGPEQLNPAYQPPPAEVRPFTERHPEVLWVVLIAVVCVLGTVAMKSSRHVGG